MSEEAKHKYVYAGAFGIYYGWDQKTGQNVILLVERGSAFKGTRMEGYGAPGGHIELGLGEQPREGAIRELGEEVLKADGSPVLDSITPDRLKFVDNGIDYGAGKADTRKAGVLWTGYRCALTPGELSHLAVHAEQMKNDPDYADAVREKSRQEVATVLLIPAQELLDRIVAGTMKFAYPHEKAVMIQVAQSLIHPPSPQKNSKPGL